MTDAVTDAVTMPASSLDPALIARIRKLLATAERTTNANEADAFSRKAAELIAAYRVDPERLRADPRLDDLAVLRLPLGRGAYVRGRLALLGVIAAANGCTTVFETHDRGTVALVAGFRTDLAGVELLYHSLHTQAASRMAAERRSTPAATQQWRRSFLFGFADQIRGMLDHTTRQAADSVDPGGASLPALRARDERVAEFARRQFGRVVAARRVKGATPSGFAAGQRAAAAADIGRARLGGLRAIGRGG